MNILPLGMNGLEPINPKKKKNSYSHRSKKTFSKTLNLTPLKMMLMVPGNPLTSFFVFAVLFLSHIY